jgi:hypothetical protein
MKKYILSLIAALVLVTGMLVPQFVHAQTAPSDSNTNKSVFQECDDQAAKQSTFCQTSSHDKNGFTPFGPNGLFTKIVQIIVWLVAIISVLMVVIGGFRYVVSGGDSNATSGAKNTILYAVIGLAVAIFAQVIVSFVLSQIS